MTTAKFRAVMGAFWVLGAVLWAWVGLTSCRAALPVRVQVYSCQVAVTGAQGITLEQCRVVDEAGGDLDQTGDDQIDVSPEGGSPAGGAGFRALGPALPVRLADRRGEPRRKRKKTSRRVRVKGYTRRAPRRRKRK